MLALATLTSKNQFTLPVSIIRLLGWTAGTRFWVKEEQGKVVLEKTKSIAELRGILANHPLSKKYTANQIVHMARRAKIGRLMMDK